MRITNTRPKYDVENLIDYKIAQIFVMNYDWPGNNNKLFKSKSGDGKWKHIMYDSDFGFERWTDLALGFIGSYETYNMLDHAIGEGNVFNNPVWSTAVLTTFLDNMDFRNKFINTYCDRLNTTYSTENTLYYMDSLRTIIEPYISDHINRYGPSIYDSYTPNTLGNTTLHTSVCKILQTIDQRTPGMRWLRFLDLVDLVILFLFI